MQQKIAISRYLIFLSFSIAIILTIVPLPSYLALYRPEWVAMLLIYWVMLQPEHINLGTAWLLGLFLDVLRGVLLGEYAFVFLIITYITTKLYKRLRLFPMWQQALSIFFLIGLGQVMIVWVRALANMPSVNRFFWLPAFTSMLCWPILTLLMNSYICQRNN